MGGVGAGGRAGVGAGGRAAWCGGAAPFVQGLGGEEISGGDAGD